MAEFNANRAGRAAQKRLAYEVTKLVHGEAAAEVHRKLGAVYRPGFTPYGRTAIDPDTTKRGLQVEFTVEDEGVFTTPWSGRVTYRRLIGDYWPEAVCAENSTFSALRLQSPRHMRRISEYAR